MAKIQAQSERSEKRSQRLNIEKERLKAYHEQESSHLHSSTNFIIENDELDDNNDIELDNMDSEFMAQSRQSNMEILINWPKKAVRTGYQTIDEDILEVLVVLISVYKFEVKKAAKIVQLIGFVIFLI